MNNIEIKISVIIPVYNSSATLNTCVESVRNQTYTNLEIILVDDCSTDDSLSICEDYAIKDPRIKVFKHTVNQGVSEARNTGIINSTGTYLGFVDSDDMIEPVMYQTMLESILENKSDICICQFRLKDYVDGAPRSIVDNSYNGLYDNSYKMIHILYNNTESVYKEILIQSVWNKLYHRDIFDGISFRGRFGEDCFVNSQIFSKQCKISIINNELYNYLYTSNYDSLSHTVTDEQRLIFLEMYIERCEKYNDQYIKTESMIRYCNLYLMYINSDDAHQIIKQGKYNQKYREYTYFLMKSHHNSRFGIMKKIKLILAFINTDLFRVSSYAWQKIRKR